MAGKKLNWCARCHHAIVTDGQRHWVHFSNDDWAGKYDCCCTIDLLPCSPKRRARPVPSAPASVAEEIARLRSRPRELYGHGLYVPVLDRPNTWTSQEIVWTGAQTWTNRGESVD